MATGAAAASIPSGRRHRRGCASRSARTCHSCRCGCCTTAPRSPPPARQCLSHGARVSLVPLRLVHLPPRPPRGPGACATVPLARHERATRAMATVATAASNTPGSRHCASVLLATARECPSCRCDCHHGSLDPHLGPGTCVTVPLALPRKALLAPPRPGTTAAPPHAAPPHSGSVLRDCASRGATKSTTRAAATRYDRRTAPLGLGPTRLCLSRRHESATRAIASAEGRPVRSARGAGRPAGRPRRRPWRARSGAAGRRSAAW